MIKKVLVSELKPGMFVHDLDAKWYSHNFLKNHFLIDDSQTLKKLQHSGLKQVYIDTSKGTDLPSGQAAASVREKIQKEERAIAEQHQPQEEACSVAQEKSRARSVVREANGIIQEVLEKAAISRNISPADIEQVTQVSKKLVDSVFRNKDALVSLTRIKEKDQYTFQHSVSVCGLMVNFSRAMNFDKQTVELIAVGSMLHDIGKMLVPNEILCKPGKLTDAEFDIMRHHVVYSREILENNPAIAQCGLDVAAQHHERVDGSGYPLRLRGDEISIYGKMSTIVDVYDALASVRCYKSAWEPSQVLQKLLEWSEHHFDPALVQQFIKSLGIYPVGSLVELTSKKLAIVIEQSQDKLLSPIVLMVYDAKKMTYLRPLKLDLSQTTEEKISAWADPIKFGIDITRFF